MHSDDIRQKAYQETQKTRRASYLSVEIMAARCALIAPLVVNMTHLLRRRGTGGPRGGRAMFNIPCRVQRCLYLFAKAEGATLRRVSAIVFSR